MNNQQFVSELSKLRTSSTFLTLKGYRNESSEIADYSIVFHMSYENALRRSIEQIQLMRLSSDVDELARDELVSSFQKSLAKVETSPIESREDGYTHFQDESGNFIKGVKLHDATNTLHLYGLVVHKRVLMPGNYPPDNRRAFTKVKDALRSKAQVGKFRQFKITHSQVDSIAVKNISLLPPV